MRAYTNNLTTTSGLMVGMGFGGTYTGSGNAVTAVNGETGMGKRAKNVALFLAAPFIGLAFVTVGPIVGLGALAWFGGKAVLKS